MRGNGPSRTGRNTEFARYRLTETRSAAMTLELVLFCVAAFAASFVAGLAGFAFGLVAMAIWLHILTPVETAILITGYALIVQGYAVWKLRSALKPRRLLPLV